MQFSIFILPALAALQIALAQSGAMPSCLANCMQNSTDPCNHSSLGALISCIDTECQKAAPGTSVTLTPKSQYSCQQSVVPGSEESSSSLTLNGNGECASSSHKFRSFILSAGSSNHMNDVAQQCRMKLYEDDHCAGAGMALDMNYVEHNTCIFYGGTSARLHCGGLSENAAAYHSLLTMCTNSTAPATNSTAPKPPFGANVTATASGSMSSHATSSPTQAPTPPFAGMANNQHVYNPSVAALIAVIAAALAML